MIEATLTLIFTTLLLLGSPGPAPLALAATGATFGVRGGLAFLAGILLGLAVAILGAILGINALFLAFPKAAVAMQIIGAAYIVFIAYKIATAAVISGESSSQKNAPTFIQGFILNLLNPKAYAAFLALFTQFLLPFENQLTAYALTGLVCFLVAVIVDVIWLCLGSLIKPMFTQPKQARLLRVSFALLMLASVAWALLK
ncbi:LysE family translocator [Marinicella rhabdoformis]|uniref:LysE family translocator n=1 Tax=Marinicella rhabdoformis TaxID=2580566 RepID=UPI0012AED446|nr:LysE family translocator [Marinicella rhabdoformis]